VIRTKLIVFVVVILIVIPTSHTLPTLRTLQVKQHPHLQMSELHDECRRTSPSMDRIRQLVNANPDSVKIHAWYGANPLHAACHAFEYGAGSFELIQYLVKQWPESVKVVSHHVRRLPLHYACASAARLEVVQFLVEKWHESVKAVDNAGNLPLHDACTKKLVCTNEDGTLEVVQCLVEKWPESVKVVDSDGSLPLHIACTNENCTLEVVQYLVQQWPESVKHKNSLGETPPDIVAGRYQPDIADDDIADDDIADADYDDDDSADGRASADIVVINWLELPWRGDRFN
jgi:hypothetical protein